MYQTPSICHYPIGTPLWQFCYMSCHNNHCKGMSCWYRLTAQPPTALCNVSAPLRSVQTDVPRTSCTLRRTHSTAPKGGVSVRPQQSWGNWLQRCTFPILLRFPPRLLPHLSPYPAFFPPPLQAPVQSAPCVSAVLRFYFLNSSFITSAFFVFLICKTEKRRFRFIG